MVSDLEKMASDGSLLDFQRQLEVAVEASGVSTEAFLAMRVGSTYGWLIPISDLSGISVVPEVSRVGRVNPWILGIGSIKGNIYTIVDLRKILAHSNMSGVISQSSLITPLNKKWDLDVAFLWEDMIGMMNVGDLILENDEIGLPEYATRMWRGKGDGIFFELDIKGLIDSAFLRPENISKGD